MSALPVPGPWSGNRKYSEEEMTMESMFKRWSLLAVAAMVWQTAAQAQVAQAPDLSALAVKGPVGNVAAPMKQRTASAKVTMAVRMTDPPLIQALGANAKQFGSSMTMAQRQAHMAKLQSKQTALMAQIGALGGVELARVGKAYNALIVSVDASKLPQIARLPGVAAMHEVTNFQKSLATSVPYIGARAVQNLGVTGTGVKIAILDSGIDYTHRNLGGSGNVVDFTTAAAAAAGAPPVGLFPTAKVIGGVDFVGENWPNSTLTPDANPIDAGIGAGHGSHVADIAGGLGGVAPGAKLYAVKVCSSVSTSCSGVAMVQGMEWAVDPNGDLDFSDAADVLNMSIGGAYGQRENPQNATVTNLVRFGMVVTISAGNSGDRPYILGGPSNTPEAISVAQTAMPNASGSPLVVTAPPAIANTYTNTNTVDWAPIVNGFSGVVRRGTTTSTAQACTLTDTIDFTGSVALIDRGVCSISIKVANAAAKGAIGVIIANNVAGDAPTFSYGGGWPLVETLVVTQVIGTTLKSQASGTVSVNVSPANNIALVGSMASTSSRGPTFNFSGIKPEIGAPGASLSAEYGTGAGETTFGGTSGAAPMVAGSAALLLQRFPQATPSEIKSRLMNAAEQAVYTSPMTAPGELAPISRIGSGEVRVDRAMNLGTGLWDASNPYNVGLAFGTIRAIGTTTLVKKVAVRNYTSSARNYTITRSFRYANDAANGAVTLNAPASISVPGNSTTAFTLTLTLDSSKLPLWNLGSALNQGTGSRLQAVEYDGYVTVSDATESASVPWHILPHKAANVVAGTSVALAGGAGSLPLSNLGGAVNGSTDFFALTGTSPKISAQMAPYGGGEVLVDLKAVGVRPLDVGGGTLGLQFGIATYGERAHPAYPAEFDIYVDSNADGTDDYVIYNIENGAFGSSGQTVVAVVNLATSAQAIRFYTDADLNSSNAIFTVLASDVGITSATQQFKFSVYAFDNRISGNLTDIIPTMTHTVGTPKFEAALSSAGVPTGFAGTLPVTAPAGGATASPSQTGLLLLYRDARTNRESDLVTVTP